MTFAFGISVVAGLRFGILPVVHLRRLRLVDALSEDRQAPVGLSIRTSIGRLRMGIMVGQVAAASVLLVGATDDPLGLVPAARQLAQQIDSRIAVAAPMTMEARLAMGLVSSACCRTTSRNAAGESAAAGLVIGLSAAFWLVRYLDGLLWGVTARDPLSYALVPVVLLAATVIACWVPARRAARIDPLIAMRQR